MAPPLTPEQLFARDEELITMCNAVMNGQSSWKVERNSNVLEYGYSHLRTDPGQYFARQAGMHLLFEDDLRKGLSYESCDSMTETLLSLENMIHHKNCGPCTFAQHGTCAAKPSSLTFSAMVTLYAWKKGHLTPGTLYDGVIESECKERRNLLASRHAVERGKTFVETLDMSPYDVQTKYHHSTIVKSTYSIIDLLSLHVKHKESVIRTIHSLR